MNVGALPSPCWHGSASSWVFLTDKSSGPSWSAKSSLLRTGFWPEAPAVPPLPLLKAETEAVAAEVGLRPRLGVEDGEEESDDGGDPGVEHGGGARGAVLGRLWSFMVPLGGGESS